MHRYHAIVDTESSWHSQIEADLETGVRPVFDLGYSRAPHGGLHSLLALYRLANARTDVTAPIYVAGGSDARWLAAMLHPDTFARPQRSSHVQILFAGDDIATYFATFSAFSPSYGTKPMPNAELGYDANIYGESISGAAKRIFVRGVQTGDIADWASLPLVEMVPDSVSAGDEQPSSADAMSDWLAWTVLLFAVALLLLAVIV